MYLMFQSIPTDGSAFQVPVYTYLAFYANSLLWTSYGLLTGAKIVLFQNLISTCLAAYSLYLLFVVLKNGIPKVELKPAGLEGVLWPIVGSWTLFILMLVLMTYNELIYAATIGKFGMILAIVQFGAPLMVMKQVLSQGYNGGLLDPQLSLLMLIMGITWSIYGNSISDTNIILPNFIGALLAAVQVFITFIVPPTKDGWPTCQGKACCQHDQKTASPTPMEV